ncbi:unnamed protein product [Laminaria digitata]
MNTINKIAARFILSVAAVTFTATASLSAPITVPAGLNPGDQYRLAFVTSTTRDAHSGNIADYNAFVTAAANTQATLAALGTTWMAIASTTTVDARDNTGTNPSSTGFPIYLLDAASTKLADNNADLWGGSIDAALNINEAGDVVLDTLVWTGTTHSGTASPNLELGDGRPGVGFSPATSDSWIALTGELQHNLLPLYAVSGVLTVAQVAEPGALGVLALGLVGLAVMRRKRMS